MLSRLFLTLCGILYLGFGLGVILYPESGLPGITASDPSLGALGDLHGSHGGINAAIGLFVLFAALSSEWHRPGLLLIALMNAGYLAGRLIVVAGQGVLSPALLSILGLEALLLAVALILAIRPTLPRRKRQRQDSMAAVESRWSRRHT